MARPSKTPFSSNNISAGETAAAGLSVHLLALLLGTAVFALFGQTYHFGFLDYDDNQYVLEVPEVAAGLTPGGIWWAFTSSHVGQVHPLTTLSFMLDVTLFGPNGGGFHLHNVLLHALATILLFYAMVKLLGSQWRAAAVAAIFALHPLHVESASWIAERKDVLSGVFMMAALLAYASAVRRRPERPAMLWTVLFFIFGLLSKPMLVTLPVLLLLLDYWPLRRFHDVGTGPLTQASRLLVEKIPMFVLSALAGVMTLIMQGEHFNPIPPLKLLPRLAYIPVNYLSYLIHFFWPFGLAAHYPYAADGPPAWHFVASVVSLVLITWVVFKYRKSQPALIMGWLWFLVGLLPVIGIFYSGIQVRADRYTYVTQLGMSMALVWLLAEWSAKRLSFRTRLTAAGMASVGLMIVSWAQVQHWKSDLALWQRSLAVTKNNAYAHSKYGRACQMFNRLDEAELHYREAMKIEPAMVEAVNNLGNIMQTRGRLDEALKLHERCVALFPKWSVLHQNLAETLKFRGSYDEARKEYLTAIELQPRSIAGYLSLSAMLIEKVGNKDAMEEAVAVLQNGIKANPEAGELWYALGNAQYRMGSEADAVASFRKAYDTDPQHGRAANNLGALLMKSGRVDEAVFLFREAIRREPGVMDAYRNLAESLAKKGDMAGATNTWREALRRDMNDARALVALSWLLATCPDESLRSGSEAIQLATRAAELTGGRDATALDSLAAALAESGRYDEAQRVALKALELAGSIPDSPLPARIKNHLESYQSGRPYRDVMSL